MSTNPTRIGVLDIQGSVAEHIQALAKIGVKAISVKTEEDLASVEGLIIPGGESTTIGKLLKKYGLHKAIQKRAHRGVFKSKHPLAVWGTCAGAILLAKKVENRCPDILKLMDVTIERNAYGRQTESFETEIWAPDLGTKKIPAIFIRAPQIKKTSSKIRVLATLGGKAVMIRQGNLLATTFHPELTADTRVHRYFVSMTQELCRK